MSLLDVFDIAGSGMAAQTVRLNTTASNLANAQSVVRKLYFYRLPSLPSIDGNTVDADVEKVEFANNALLMQASLMFLNGRFRGLISAIKGE